MRHSSIPRFALTQRGLSLIELMVGIAIGLFIVGGAIKLTVDNLSSNRRLLVEARVNQDLRAAADIIARDLRRAGYWESAVSGVWSAGYTSVSATNPFGTVTDTSEQVTYGYERPGVAASDPNASNLLGFKRVVSNSIGSIQIQNAAGGWQDLTDANAIDVTAFSITETERPVELWPYCACRTKVPVIPACEQTALSNSSTRPRLMIREYTVKITAQAVSGGAADSTVTREILETVRVRNDVVTNPNGCPIA